MRQYTNSPTEKFLTTQHERDQETGLDYRGARFYDSDVARFLSLDPLATDYPSLSDYSYVAGNPIIFSDPTGMSVENNGNGEGNNEEKIYEGGTFAPVIHTYYRSYSKEFNALSEHNKNFILHKWRSMEEGNLYRQLLGEAIMQGASEQYYAGFSDNSDWWGNEAQENWRKGATAWDPNGTGTFWMNTATVAIGGTILLTTGAAALETLPAGGGPASFTALGSSRGGSALQSGGLNFATQLYGNGFDIGAVDWTGVGSATLTGFFTGPGPKSLLIGSAGGAIGDAAFDYSINDGFATVFNQNSNSGSYKSFGTFGRDFGFGIVGNFMGGVSSVSGGFKPLSTPSLSMEFLMDGVAINGNIKVNKANKNIGQ